MVADRRLKPRSDEPAHACTCCMQPYVYVHDCGPGYGDLGRGGLVGLPLAFGQPAFGERVCFDTGV